MADQRFLFYQHLAQTSPYPPAIEIEKSEGVYLYDSDGKSYFDFISGISVSNLGHRHPSILSAIKEQLDRYLHVMVFGEFIQSPQVKYATRLAQLLPPSLSTVYFTNSGSEAAEGGIKLAKRYTGRTEIICFRNAYHGSTQGALSVCGNESLKEAYRPLLPGIRILNFNDKVELSRITDQTAAVIIEPIQGEAGIIMPEEKYLAMIREQCTRTGALLIFDEIQSGMGRTGKLFAFQDYDVTPDILLAGKAFGGGMPLGAFISSREIMQVLSINPMLGHITTFGGHPVSCAAGLAAMDFITGSGLLESIPAKEKLFRSLLHHPSLPSLRGKGLLLALELDSAEMTQEVIRNCADRGLLTDWFLFAPNCLRIAPPLIISETEIQSACQILMKSITQAAKLSD